MLKPVVQVIAAIIHGFPVLCVDWFIDGLTTLSTKRTFVAAPVDQLAAGIFPMLGKLDGLGFGYRMTTFR